MSVNRVAAANASNTELPPITEEPEEPIARVKSPPPTPPLVAPLHVALNGMLATPVVPRMRSFQRNGLVDEMQQMQVRLEQLEEEVRQLRAAVLGSG